MRRRGHDAIPLACFVNAPMHKRRNQLQPGFIRSVVITKSRCPFLGISTQRTVKHLPITIGISGSASHTKLTAMPWNSMAISGGVSATASVATTASTRNLLLLAFLLGGLFFSRILPRFLTIAAACLRRIIQLRNGTPTKNRFFTTYRRLRRTKTKFAPNYTHVPKSGLVVLQHVVENLAGRSFQTQMRRALQEAMEEQLAADEDPNIRRIDIDSFVMNPTPHATPPSLKQGRIYHLQNETDNSNTTMAFDVELEWKNCLQADLFVTTKRLGLLVPIRIDKVHFAGPVRIILTPLSDQPPGFGACLVSLPRLPNVLEWQVTVAGGQITNVPWLREELQAALQNLLSERLVWPNRIVNSMLQEPPKAEFNATILSSQELSQLERTDPLLTEMQRGAIQQRNKASKSRLTKKGDASSPWNQLFDGLKRLFQWEGDHDKEDEDDWVSTTSRKASEAAKQMLLGHSNESSTYQTEKKEIADARPKFAHYAESNRATSPDKDGRPASLSWEKLFDTVVRPLTLAQKSDHAPDISNNNTIEKTEPNGGSLPNLAEMVEEMTHVESLEEFMSLFDDETNNNKK